MVTAILDGSKTQTRRVCNHMLWDHINHGPMKNAPHIYGEWATMKPSPYGQPGDQLWVKETYRSQQANESQSPVQITIGDPIRYEADGHETANPLYGWGRIRQSIFMRKWMSRIALQIANIRIERLQDISEEDAKAEGVDWTPFFNEPVESYARLWKQINGPESWEQNPYVWAITFKRITP